MKKLYVANLGYGVRDEDLRNLFLAHGPVRSAEVIRDRGTGESRGFGFVEMEDERDARAALAGLHGKDVRGRPLSVTEARPKEGQPGTPRKPAVGKPGRKRPPALARRLRRPRQEGP